MTTELNAQNLVAAIEQAESESHVKEFEVGGQLLTFPRLSLGDQGKFETMVQIDESKRTGKPSTFSLGGVRNKSSLTLANIMAGTQREISEMRKQAGDKPLAATKEEAEEMAKKLQEGVMEKFEPYADRIFAGFNRSHMAYAIAMSMADQYGPNITYTKEVDGEKIAISSQIDGEFVDRLFKPESGRIFENVFSYVVGLAEKPKKTAAQVAAGMSVGDIAKETIGDEKNSEREQDSE